MARTPTGQLLYLDLGTGNGGIVLNVSEEGCGFLSIAPVWDKRPHFSFAIGGGRKIQGDGKVVWVDESKKLGGLRFVNTSQAFREQVRAWLAEPKAPEAPQAKAGKETRVEAKANAEAVIAAPMGTAESVAEVSQESEALASVETGSAAEPESVELPADSAAEVKTAATANIDFQPQVNSPGGVNANFQAPVAETAPDSSAKQRRKQLRDEARAQLQRGQAAPAPELHQRAQSIQLRTAPGVWEKTENLRVYLRRGGWKLAAALGLGVLVVMIGVMFRQQVGAVLMRVGTSLADRQENEASTSEAQAAAVERPSVPDAGGSAQAGGASAESGSENTGTDASGGGRKEGEDRAEIEKAAAAQTVTMQRSTLLAGAVKEAKAEQVKAESGLGHQAEPANSVASVGAKQGGTASGGTALGSKTGAAVSNAEPKKKGPYVTPEQIQALWSEVEAGDVSAEVHLGQLYAHGNGVPKSCGQARMLLNSAAKKGSVEAKQKLEELAEAGCP